MQRYFIVTVIGIMALILVTSSLMTRIILVIVIRILVLDLLCVVKINGHCLPCLLAKDFVPHMDVSSLSKAFRCNTKAVI
jgi:hypothetical protein